MNIGLDARSIFSRQPRGTGRNLADAVRALGSLCPEWSFTLYHQRRADECPQWSRASFTANVHPRRIDLPGDRWDAWFQLRLPTAAWLDRIDLLHLPANAAPAWCPVPFLVTIHDLAPLRIAGELPGRATRRFRQGVTRAVGRARHIIVPSQATRDELRAEFGRSNDDVTVIPWAPDAALLASAHRQPDPRLSQRYALSRPWLLNFSGPSLRKNATGLLAAWGRVGAELRRRLLLVLVGCGNASFRAQLAARAAELGVAGDCRFLEFVPVKDLAGLLGGSRALLMPSLHEGFGLPILDAFASGVPVPTSRRSSMPEVAGEAAVYCDPTSPQSIAAGISSILQDEVRDRLIARGYQRVRQFTWERTARAMAAVYERCRDARPRAACNREVPLCR